MRFYISNFRTIFTEHRIDVMYAEGKSRFDKNLTQKSYEVKKYIRNNGEIWSESIWTALKCGSG